MLANILVGIGHAFFAANFIPFLLGLAELPIIVVVLLLGESIFCWAISIVILGGIKNDYHH